jgi:hypothetical protein
MLVYSGKLGDEPNAVVGKSTLFWEPWGLADPSIICLCKNHKWNVTYETFDPSDQNARLTFSQDCPALPYGGWNMGGTNPHPSITFIGDDAWDRKTWLRYDKASNPDDPDVDLTARPILRIKAKAFAEFGGGLGTFVDMAIYSAEAPFRVMYCLAHAVHAPGDSWWMIGDNGGEEQKIDLSLHGLTGKLTAIEFILSSRGGPGETQYTSS